uniref:Uncharacterized protein n=1 Tax=viral metagenome TaxID=1070528 RepID=A0A6M3KAW8_9ZZZZ
MISERTLRKWRKDALKDMIGPKDLSPYLNTIDEIRERSRRILSLTQELLDQHLTKKP